jgi:hypothetical protein
MRKLLGVLTALVALLGVGVVAAPTAQAGVSPHIITVQGPSCAPSATSVAGNPGSVFTILAAPACGIVFFDALGSGAAPVTPVQGYVAPGLIVTLGASGSGVFDLYVGATQPKKYSVTVTVTTDPVPEPTVHDELQQIAVPASGDCADVTIDTGYYPGAPIGGWTLSWAQWINDGKGGSVCTRELEVSSDGTVVLIG